MRFTVWTIGALAISAALAGCGAPKDSATTPASVITASSGAGIAATDGRPAAFAQCAACHAVVPGKNGIGPSLAGVFGRKAGQAPGYAYSAANLSSGLTWDEATLDEYLTAPAKKVPGTKMTYAGQADPAARQALIAYLKTLK